MVQACSGLTSFAVRFECSALRLARTTIRYSNPGKASCRTYTEEMEVTTFAAKALVDRREWRDD
jgi:hypothetical protein